MAPIASPPETTSSAQLYKPVRVRKALLVALALSLVLHAVWTLWPVDPTDTSNDTVLTVTLAEMPPPPMSALEPVPAPAAKRARPRPPRPRATPPPPPATVGAIPESLAPSAEEVTTEGAQDHAAPRVEPPVTAAASDGNAAITEPTLPPPVVLPPRVDLAYKVFLGTQGFLIGDATYRFEHSGDRYRISTVGQARGLAALLMRGTGKIESRGRITPAGLRPHEFAIERGSSQRREVAFFDWDAGNVVLHDGATAHLEPPTFDPLTILWQPYFSPPGTGAQVFSLATTRRVARYTLTLQAEETIAWPRGEILTQRWHRRSDDGHTDAWFWLAPSMHHIPIKMRVARTSRGTLEVVLDSIRVDDSAAEALLSESMDSAAEIAAEPANAKPEFASDVLYGMPGSALPPMRADDLRGQ